MQETYILSSINIKSIVSTIISDFNQILNQTSQTSNTCLIKNYPYSVGTTNWGRDIDGR